MPENGRFPFGINGLKVFVTSDQEDIEWSMTGANIQRAPSGKDAQQPRRASSDQKGIK